MDVVRRRKRLSALAPRTKNPVICQVNGQWISRKAWNRRICDGDSVVFIQLPQGGGGGGGGGSNPLKIVLTIAVMVVAFYAAPAIAGAMGVTSSIGVSITQGIIGMIGNMLVSALIPAPSNPAASQMSASGGLASPSPTYNLGAQGNSARIGQPIPCIYGRHQVLPDFAAMPYVEYAGNEQYLYQLFCIGQGEYEIEAIRIEDTPISSFPEVTYEIVPPGGSVTLFPSRVITSVEVSGQEALNTTTLGPFVANPSGTLANFLAVDIVMSRGVYYANNAGGLDGLSMAWTVEAQEVNDLGVAIGSWFVLGNETFSAATNTPQRLSYKYPVTAGRYQVRLLRSDEKNLSSRAGHEIDWAALRAYLPGDQTYGNVTMVAMRMRATNSLSSQASRKINFIVTRKLNTWHPVTGWSASKVPTRSIAWAFADACRSDYGAELPDNRIGLQALYDLDAIWSARGDTFNAVFDSQSTVMEALGLISRAGRAISFLQGGVVHCVRDQPATIPVALFSQRNIVKNSLSIDYLMPTEETADCVEVTYFDEDIWRERSVTAILPGGTSNKPAKVKLFGVTNRQQAWQEGMYTAACNQYRRRMPSFSTEMEGFIPALCDLIAVQHDMPKWGQSGEFVSFNITTAEAILSEPLDWSAGGAHVIAFRRRDGSVAGPYAATAGADAYHVTLGGWVSGTDPLPDTGGDRERSHFAFGPANQQYIKCRMMAMRPRSSETVEISAVVESDYVHTADTGVAPGVTAWQLPSKRTSPVVSGLTVLPMPGAPDKMSANWQPAAGADFYLFEQSSGDGKWTRSGEPTSSSFTAQALYGGNTVVRVAGFGLTLGPWAVFDFGATLRAPLANIQNMVSVFRSGLTVIVWDAVTDPLRTVEYEVRKGASWTTAQILGRTTSTEFQAVGDGMYWVAARSDLAYSAAPTAIVISGAVTQNVIADYDEASIGWPGTRTGGAVLRAGDIILGPAGNILTAINILAEPDVIWYGGVSSSGVYELPAGHAVDIGRVAPCPVMIGYTVRGESIFDNVLTLPNVLAVTDWLSDALGAKVTIQPQIALAQDDGIFGAWQNFIPGSYIARHFKARALISSSDPQVTAVLSGLTFAVDVPDRIVEASVLVSAGGMTIPYTPDFNGGVDGNPVPLPQITILNAQQGDDVILSSQTLSGFSVQVINAGAGVARSINYKSQGY